MVVVVRYIILTVFVGNPSDYILPMSKVQFFHDIFAEVQAAKNIDARVKILQENKSEYMDIIAQMAFNDHVVFDLPEGVPPYVKNPHLELNSIKQIRRMINCLKGKPLPAYKKEQHFCMVLDALPEKDAEILIAAKDRKLPELCDSLSRELFKLAFPKLAL